MKAAGKKSKSMVMKEIQINKAEKNVKSRTLSKIKHVTVWQLIVIDYHSFDLLVRNYIQHILFIHSRKYGRNFNLKTVKHKNTVL